MVIAHFYSTTTFATVMLVVLEEGDGGVLRADGSAIFQITFVLE